MFINQPVAVEGKKRKKGEPDGPHKVKKIHSMGAGMWVQLGGLVLIGLGFATLSAGIGLFLLPIGIALIFQGSRMATRYYCSECAEKVKKDARKCIHCGTIFEGK